MLRSLPALLATALACRPGSTAPVDPPREPDPTVAPTADTAAEAPGPTWRDVAPILESRCVGCHLEGEVAPMALDRYETAAAWAPRIADVTRARIMPPYLVDPSGSCQEFTDPAWLTDAELDTLEAWADAGAPAGGPTEVLVPPEVEHLVDPDVTVDIGVDFTATEPDQYRCFIAELGLDTTKYLTAYEVVPGQPSMVHHVTLFTLDNPEAERRAAERDARDDLPGYECFGGPGVSPSRQVGGWAPGTPTTRLPEGTGLKLYRESSIVIEVHYHAQVPLPDRTALKLELADTVPTEAMILSLYDMTMVLPPGEAEVPYSFTSDTDVLVGDPVAVNFYGIFPHLHERGRSIRLERTRGGATDCLADVPRWDFNWQQSYFYREPIRIEPTDELEVSCTFDTSGDTEPVPFGERTEDEMCVFGVLATL